jgi:hypothetical protein
MKEGEENISQREVGEIATISQAITRSCAPPVDLDEFRKDADQFDITEEQKTKLLQILWSIAFASVDIEWRIDSTQRILSALGEFSSAAARDMLEQTKNVQHFNDATTSGTER